MNYFPFHMAIIDDAPEDELTVFLAADSKELDRVCPEGLTALHLAIQHGRRELVARLLTRGANRSIGDDYGFQAIHHASQTGDVEIIAKLLRMGEDPGVRTNSGMTPLLIALGNGHAQAVNAILEHLKRDSDRVSIYGEDLQWEGGGQEKQFEPWICTLGCGEVVDGLMVASQRGFNDIVTLLCEHGAEVNRMTLNEASHSPEVLWEDPQFVLSQGGITPLHFACQDGHVGTVSALLSKGAKVNVVTKSGASPLLVACERGHLEVVNLLLSNRAMVNTSSSCKQPIQAAIQIGRSDIISRLIQYGADWTETDDRGNTTLHVACKNGRLDVVTDILEKLSKLRGRFDLNIHNKHGNTPLHLATKQGQTAIVLLLINHNGNTNAQNKFGSTPVHLAVENDNVGLVKKLLSHGGDPTVCDNAGHTPVDKARMLGDQHMVDILNLQASDDVFESLPKGMVQRLQMRRGSHDSAIQRPLVQVVLAATKGDRGVRHSMVDFPGNY